LTIKVVIETSAQSRDHIVCTEFEGGEGILVDLNTKRYYQLNDPALLIWNGVEIGRTLDEIVNEVLAQYAVDRRHARQSVETLLRSLISYRLVES
jgi:hypothetical protein